MEPELASAESTLPLDSGLVAATRVPLPAPAAPDHRPCPTAQSAPVGRAISQDRCHEQFLATG